VRAILSLESSVVCPLWEICNGYVMRRRSGFPRCDGLREREWGLDRDEIARRSWAIHCLRDDRRNTDPLAKQGNGFYNLPSDLWNLQSW